MPRNNQHVADLQENENVDIKGVGMIRAEIGLENMQIINETYSFHYFLIL